MIVTVLHRVAVLKLPRTACRRTRRKAQCRGAEWDVPWGPPAPKASPVGTTVGVWFLIRSAHDHFRPALPERRVTCITELLQSS